MLILSELTRKLVALLFIVSVALWLVLFNLNRLVVDPDFYALGHAKYDVASSTRLSEAELRTVTRGLIRYFSSYGTTLAEDLTREGASRQLFNEREIIHLGDVRDLIHLGVRAQQTAEVYAALFLIGSYFWQRRRYWTGITGYCLWASGLALLALALVGLASLVNFVELFTQFHLVSFSNDLWRLDPRTDILIRMFPEEFFFDATAALALRSAVAAVVLGGVAGGFLLWQRVKNPTEAGGHRIRY